MEIPVPPALLDKDYLAPPNKDLYFGKTGNIRWYLRKPEITS